VPANAPVFITQVLTLNVPDFNISEYDGDMKMAYETGYGVKLKIFVIPPGIWKGGSVSSEINAARRGRFQITFTARVRGHFAATARAEAKSATAASLMAAVQQAATYLKDGGSITTTVRIFTPAETESLSQPTISAVPTSAPTAAPAEDSSSSGGGPGAVVIVVIVVCLLVFIALVVGTFCCLEKLKDCCLDKLKDFLCCRCCGSSSKEETVAVKSSEIGIEMEQGNAPPPGAVYMKNGVWLDKNDKPVGAANTTTPPSQQPPSQQI
jgi:hypothetical protein